MFVAVACTRSAVMNNQSNTPKVSGSSVTNVAAWQDFADPTSGFGFKYPQTWSVGPSTKYSECVFDENHVCAIGVNIEKSPDESNEVSAVSNEKLMKEFETKYSNVQKDQMVVNNLHINKYSVADETQVFIETTDYDYILNISKLDSPNNYETIKSVLDQLIPTLNISKK
jgi:hypothetical protein